MKKLLVAGMAAAALCAAPALAADMPVKAPYAPVFNWTGFYVGGNGGYAWTTDPGNLTIVNNTGAFVQTPNTEPKGWFGGGQVGFNWQTGKLVLGIESDFEGANIKDSFNRISGGALINDQQKVDYFGTVRARAGIAFDRLLVYATGGLAYGDLHYNVLVNGVANPVKNFVDTGVVFGGGAEYAFWNGWSLKAEYQYINFRATQASAPVVPPNGVTIFALPFKTELQTVRLGLNYRFGTQ